MSKPQSAPAGARDLFAPYRAAVLFRESRNIADDSELRGIVSDAFTSGATWQRTQSAGVPESDVSSEAWLQEWARDKFTYTGRYKGGVYGNTDWALARALHSAMLAAAPAQPAAQDQGEVQSK